MGEQVTSLSLTSEKKQLEKSYRLLPENGSSQGHNLAMTVLSVPNSLDTGRSRAPLLRRRVDY